MSDRSDSDRSEIENAKGRAAFRREIEAKTARKLKARSNPAPGVWFGLGMMGLIGWSVVVPTLLGAALGIWLDNRHPGNHPWTLTLLTAGLLMGCFNAWNWVAREDRAMHEQKDDDSSESSSSENSNSKNSSSVSSSEGSGDHDEK